MLWDQNLFSLYAFNKQKQKNKYRIFDYSQIVQSVYICLSQKIETKTVGDEYFADVLLPN